MSHINALYNEYVTGNDPIPNQKRVLEEIPWLKKVDVVNHRSLSSYAHQPCSNLIVSITYQVRISQI